MNNKKEINNSEDEVSFNLTQKQKKLIFWLAIVGVYALMAYLLFYMMSYVELLSTNPCDLCTQFQPQW